MFRALSHLLRREGVETAGSEEDDYCFLTPTHSAPLIHPDPPNDRPSVRGPSDGGSVNLRTERVSGQARARGRARCCRTNITTKAVRRVYTLRGRYSDICGVTSYLAIQTKVSTLYGHMPRLHFQPFCNICKCNLRIEPWILLTGLQAGERCSPTPRFRGPKPENRAFAFACPSGIASARSSRALLLCQPR